MPQNMQLYMMLSTKEANNMSVTVKNLYLKLQDIKNKQLR